nr:HAMP domain-containing histidine kinase [candidate division Zixibacteria bacterium]
MALVIFIGLVVFCLAQLTWWIVFQIENNRDLKQARIELLRMTTGNPDQIPSPLLEQIEREARGRVVMFVSEGTFFMLIVLLGAYLIYRSLLISEDLKARQRNFIEGVTHEFRTPLTSLKLYLETLQSGNLEAGKVAELYPKMLDDCDHLDNLIDNVLEAGHFGKGPLRLELSRTDLYEDLNEYLDGLEPLVKRYGGELRQKLEKNIMAQTEYQSLGRAVRILVDNALKYSPPDRKVVEVELSSLGGKAVIKVADQGIGIPDGEKRRIFERFYRVNNPDSPNPRGTGLGLYLLSQIVEAHHGEVDVASGSSGRGTTFTIRIPLAER